MQSGKIEFGLIPLEQAASNAPDNPDIRYHLAAALAKAGDKKRAKEELSSILQSDRQFSERAAALALQKRTRVAVWGVSSKGYKTVIDRIESDRQCLIYLNSDYDFLPVLRVGYIKRL